METSVGLQTYIAYDVAVRSRFRSISKWIAFCFCLCFAIVCYGQAPQKLTFNPTTVVSGGSSSATVFLASAAPSGGLAIKISSSSSEVTVPSSVTVSAGASSATFTLSTKVSLKAYSSTVKVSDFAGSISGTLNVSGEGISSISFSPTQVLAGVTAAGTVTLLQPAPAGGWVVSLKSTSSAVSVGSSVSVPQGKTSASFSVATFPGYITQNTTVSVTGTDATSTASGSFTLLYESLKISLSQTTVSGGKTITGSVTLAYPAPSGGETIFLTIANPDAAEATDLLIIPAGATQTSFPILVSNLSDGASATVNIEANDGVAVASVNLTVTPDPILGLSLSPYTVAENGGSTATIDLKSPAPSGGTSFSLSSSNTSAKVPASVKVAAGATSVSFAITTTTVTKNTVVTITAKPQSGASLSVNLTVKPSLVRWSFALNAFVQGDAVAPNGNVYLATDEGQLIALNSSGKSVWTYGTEFGPFLSAPAVASNGDICATDSNNSVDAIDPQGDLVWSNQIAGEASLSNPVVSGSSIYFFGSTGTLYAFSITGSPLWKLRTSVESTYAPPTVGANGMIYFVGQTGGKSLLYALSSTGAVKWTAPIDQSASSPTLGPDGSIYVQGSNGALFALSSAGQLKWIYLLNQYSSGSIAFGPDGTIYAADDTSVVALNTTGTVKWVFFGPDYPYGLVVAKTGEVYFNDELGNVYAINGSGDLIWNFAGDGDGYGVNLLLGPDGTVYVGSNFESFDALYP